MKHTTVLGCVVFALVLSTLPRAQEPQRAIGTVKEGVTAVLVDVVVRDRRGQPVRDLKAADFEILEDGVQQQVGSFTPILAAALAGGASAPAAPSAAGTPAAGPGNPIAAG